MSCEWKTDALVPILQTPVVMGMIPWDTCSFDVCDECDGCQNEAASVYKIVQVVIFMAVMIFFKNVACKRIIGG